jgi:hypothetical protein
LFTGFFEGCWVFCAVILDVEGVRDFGPEHGDVFVGSAGPVHSGGDEEPDLVLGHACVQQGVDELWEKGVVGDWARDVGDDDDDVSASAIADGGEERGAGGGILPRVADDLCVGKGAFWEGGFEESGVLWQEKLEL